MVRIGTWNLENLFRPGGDAGPTTAEVYRAKLAALAGTIGGLDPDVLAVQEVGDPTALRELAERIGGGYDHAVTAAPDGRRIRVGFLSRLPLANVQGIAPFAAGLPVSRLMTPTSWRPQWGGPHWSRKSLSTIVRSAF